MKTNTSTIKTHTHTHKFFSLPSKSVGINQQNIWTTHIQQMGQRNNNSSTGYWFTWKHELNFLANSQLDEFFKTDDNSKDKQKRPSEQKGRIKKIPSLDTSSPFLLHTAAAFLPFQKMLYTYTWRSKRRRNKEWKEQTKSQMKVSPVASTACFVFHSLLFRLPLIVKKWYI